MSNSIRDANGWPSEPDIKIKHDRITYQNRRRKLDAKLGKNDRQKEKQLSEQEVETAITPQEDAADIQAQSEPENTGLSLPQRVELIRKQLEIKEAHDALMNALDAAIAAEKELGEQLYAIENLKKNTLTSADYAHGDNADFESIIESANIAKAKAIEKPNILVDIASDKMTELEALTQSATIGRGLMALIDGGEYSFTEAESDKIDTLRDTIEDNKAADEAFTRQTPYDVDERDYQAAMSGSKQYSGVGDEMDEPEI